MSVCDLETTTIRKPRPDRAVEPWKRNATFTSSDTIFFKKGAKQGDVYSLHFSSYGSNFILSFRLTYYMLSCWRI